MSRQPAAAEPIAIALLARLVAGLITGIAARIIMRVVALTAHKRPIFGLANSLRIVWYALVIGLVAGAVYALCAFLLARSARLGKHLPGYTARGLGFGVLLLVLVGLPAVLVPLDRRFLDPKDLNLGISPLTKGLFAALPLIFGVTLGVTEKALHR
jgi:hypothetical protein